jgi:RNA polymerase sigma factor (TIGR02999 family)
MEEPAPNQITQLLRSWSDGDEAAIQQLIPLVYGELHRLARRYMSDEKPGHTLQTTALINEAYLRLVHSPLSAWDGRNHFFAVCAQVMRRILVDWARSRRSLKRGSDVPALQLDEALAQSIEPGQDLVAIDEALKALALVDQRKAQVIEMRFFGGLSVTETAGVLKISEETVHRDWRLAKHWLRQELRRDHAGRR